MVPVLIYVSHPFHGARKLLDKWMRWCYLSTSDPVSFVTGVNMATLTDLTVDERARAAKGNLDILARADWVLFVGRMTDLMRTEREAAERLGLVVLDITYLGINPPHAMPSEFFPVYDRRSGLA